MSLNLVDFKHEKDKEMFFGLTPLLIQVVIDMAIYCKDQELPFVITDTISTITEDKLIKRVSSSHRQKRAVDISVKGWEEYHILDFVRQYNLKYKDIAAISGTTFEPTLVVYHSNIGWHLHVQLHPRFAIIEK